MCKDTLIIIPAFNEEPTIEAVIKDLKKHGLEDVLVVDDGSKDKTSEVAKKCGATVVSHIINIGLGAAISTGLDFAREHNYQMAITIDADGQHSVDDAKNISIALKSGGADLVIGSRILDLKKKYRVRYVINVISNIVTYFISGVFVSDSQSGLRGFGPKAINKIYPQTSGYEVSSEIIVTTKRECLTILEIPISARYSKYSLEKGQKVTNSLNVIRKLLSL